MEEWRTVKEFPNYEVSSLGRVKRETKILKPHICKRGYYTYNFHLGGGIQKTVYLHRILAIAFVENPLNLPCVDHINRNRLDNSLSNLRWVTKHQNGINRIRGVTGELYISTTDCGTYRLQMPSLQKRFKTLDEAIKARDEILNIQSTSTDGAL